MRAECFRCRPTRCAGSATAWSTASWSISRASATFLRSGSATRPSCGPRSAARRPRQPGDADAALDALLDQALPFIQHPDHPRFFARIGSPSNFISVLADAAASGFNVFAGSWTGGSGPGDRRAGGARLAARAVRAARGRRGRARQRRLGGEPGRARRRARAVRRRGRGGCRLRLVGGPRVGRRGRCAMLGMRVRPRRARDATTTACTPTTCARRSRPTARRAAPFCVVATAGTTSTGAVDPLEELADLAGRLWLHVDGAYGAPAVLWPGAPRSPGCDRADSLVLDPHKWLFQPYEIGCVLVREPGLLERTFSLSGVYLRDTMGEEVNFRDRSVQLTRGVARAQALAVDARLRRWPRSARRSPTGSRSPSTPRRLLRARPGWEVVTPAQLAIVCFRARGRGRARRARGRDGRRRLRRAEHDRGRRARRAAPVHDQSAHDVRGHRADDRAHGGAIRILRLS